MKRSIEKFCYNKFFVIIWIILYFLKGVFINRWYCIVKFIINRLIVIYIFIICYKVESLSVYFLIWLILGYLFVFEGDIYLENSIVILGNGDSMI